MGGSMKHINLKLFLEKILEGCLTDFDKVYRLLTSRGFLLDIIDGEITVSDNSHKSDEKNLNDILVKSGIGYTKNSKVIFREEYDWKRLLNLYDKVDNVNDEVTRHNWSDCWTYFVSRTHGYKVAAVGYEPYISKYLKATSSIGITTYFSCDAHHETLNKSIKIRFVSRFDLYWHKLLHESIFRFEDNPNFKWIYNTTNSEDLGCIKKLSQDLESITMDYVSLIKMGDSIYDNRIQLRKLKSDFIKDISGKINNHTPDTEAFQIMNETLQRIIKESYNLSTETYV